MSWRAKYTLLRYIGEGAYGEVHAARDRAGRLVALKRIANLPDYVDALWGEATKLWDLLGVPGVVQLIDHDLQCEEPYIVLELMEGSLHDRLGGRAQSPQLAAAVGLQLARAVHNAHLHGVMHLDLKPENVLLLRGQLKIADFGSAHGFASLVVSGGGGTPGYIAPERRYGATTHAADVYAVGAVLYQMLTGQRPPADRSELDPRWFAPLCPPELVVLVQSMTASRPEDRPPLAWVEEECRSYMNRAAVAAQQAAVRSVPAAPQSNAGPAIVLGSAATLVALAVGGPLAAGGVALLSFLLGARGRRR